MKAQRGHQVRVVFTGADYMQRGPIVHGWATSKTAAVKAARMAGYRVMTAGGIVELATDDVSAITGNEVEAWTVTVHPR
jgi:hypothetical protein